jgi:hypothetical protein
MSADVIKEFLISLSFSKDETGFHRTMEAVEGLTKKMVVLGGAIEAAAIASVAAMHRIAMGMEAVGYASSRIGASVSGIKEFQFAISQLGGTAAGAMTSLENFSRFMRESPGGEAWLRGFGIQTRDAKGQLRDRKELLDAFFASNRFTKEEYWAKLRDAQFVGIDENTMRAGMNPQRAAMEAEARAKYRNTGFDPDKAAENAKKFEQAWRSAFMSIEIMIERLADKFGPQILQKFKEFTDWVDTHGPEISNIVDQMATSLSDAVKWIWDMAKAIAAFVHDDADPWIKQTTGINNGLEKLAFWLGVLSTTAIPALGLALTALMAGPALRALVGLLSLAGFGSVATFVGGGAILGSAIGAYNATPGADEKPPEGALEEGADAIDKWAARKWRQRPKWLGGNGGESIRKGTRGGNPGEGSSAGNLTKLIEEEARKAGIDPRVMQGIRAGESLHTSRYDKKDDALESSWGPFQLNRRRGLGVDFERDTGLDVRNPDTIPAQVRWVANYLKHGGSLQPWAGYHGPRDADPRWGDSGYHPTEVAARAPANAPSSSFGLNGWIAPGGGYAHAAPAPAAPIGHSSVNSYDFGNNIMNNHAKTTIVINGAGDPGATADAVAKKQGSLYSDALRNLQGAAR